MEMKKIIKNAYQKPTKKTKTETSKKNEDYSLEIKTKKTNLKPKKVKNSFKILKKFNFISKKKEKDLAKKLEHKSKEVQLNEKINALKKVVEKEKKENALPSLDDVVKYLSFVDQDIATKIIKELPEEDVLKITKELLKKPKVDEKEKEFLTKKFNTYFKKVAFETEIKGSNEFAKKFLEETLGKEKAKQVCRKVLDDDLAKPKNRKKLLTSLKKYDSQVIYTSIRDEGEFISSFVIMELENKQAAEVLSLFSFKKQKEIVKRISKMKTISVFAIDGIVEKIEKKAELISQHMPIINNGKLILEEIIKNMDIDEADSFIKNMKYVDEEMGLALEKMNMTNSILNKIEQRDLQHILLGYSEKDLAVVLIDKEENFKERILSNVSSRRREIILKELELLAETPKKIVEQTTDTFLDFVKTLSYNN